MNYYLSVWQNFGNFSGRASRSEYWFFVLLNYLAFVILFALAVLFSSSFFVIVGCVYACIGFIPSLAVAVRRMHDVGKSGWHLLIPIYSIILCFSEGDKGENYYGSDPKNTVSFDFETSTQPQ